MKTRYNTFNFIICLCLHYFLCNNAVAQYSVAGMHGGIYIDIVPDTLLDATPMSSGAYDYPFYVDINQDGTNDVLINAHNTITSGATVIYVVVTSQNSSTSLSFGSLDSTYHNPPSPPCQTPWWSTVPVLKMYNNGDTIHNATYVTSGYLGYQNATGTGQCAYQEVYSEWLNTGDVFIGVKYKTTSDTLYGWIKVNVTDYYKVLIKECSLGVPSNVGINSAIDLNNIILIYPNPATNYLKINVNNNNLKSIKIYDLLGKEVLSTNEKEIDIHLLHEGIYFVIITTNQGVVSKKLVIQQ